MSTPPDPQTAAAVDRMRAELAALPEIPMPPDVAERIARSLAGGADGRPDPAHDEGPGALVSRRPLRLRPRREATGRRAALSRAAVLACAAASLVAVLIALPGAGTTGPTPAGSDVDLRSAGAVTFGQDGAGMLADPARRRDCLAAAGVPEPGAVLLGGRPYAVDGEPGTLLVLGTAVTGRYRLVVVDAGCGPAGGRVLSEALVGH